MNVYEAISIRKSVRQYQMKPLEDEILSSIQKYINEITPFYKEIPYEFRITNMLEKNSRKKKGLFSVKAPYYISLVLKDTEGMFFNAGYLAEQMLLYLTCRGIGTCYQGNLHVLDQVKQGYKEVIVFACGYPLHYPHREERLAKRIPLGRLCLFKEEPDKNVMTILRAANLAPSSFNNQPWRFIVYNNRIHIFLQKDSMVSAYTRKLREIDMGIVLAHMSLAAEELWLNVRYEENDAVSNQNFKRKKYITTMLLL